MIHLEFWPTLAFVGMMLSWFAFVIVFLVRHKPPAAPESKRERASIVGIVLQGAGYAFVWSIRRAWFSPIISVSNSLEIALAILTIALGDRFGVVRFGGDQNTRHTVEPGRAFDPGAQVDY